MDMCSVQTDVDNAAIGCFRRIGKVDPLERRLDGRTLAFEFGHVTGEIEDGGGAVGLALCVGDFRFGTPKDDAVGDGDRIREDIPARG